MMINKITISTYSQNILAWAALIAQHADEKNALEKGAGHMGPIILEAWGNFSMMPSGVELILSNEETVIDFIKRMKRVTNVLEREFAWGTGLGRVTTTPF